MNCMQNECKFLNEDYEDNYICTKNNIIISEEQMNLFDPIDSPVILDCDNFEQQKSCNTCKYSCSIYYDDDCEDYHCKLQNRKMIYSDIAIYRHNNSDFPKCNIDKWESDGF